MWAVGKHKAFRNREEGLKAGFFDSFNDLAKHHRAIARGDTPEPVVEPPAEEEVDIEEVTTTPSAPQRPMPDLSSAEVKDLAEQYDIPTENVHHMTLRKQVEEYLDAQRRGD